jgi:hypothetical protein
MVAVDFTRTEWRYIERAIKECRYFVEWRDTIAYSLNINREALRVEPSDPFTLGEEEGCLFLAVRPIDFPWRMARLSYMTFIAIKKERFEKYGGYGPTFYTIYLIEQLEIGHPMEKIQASTGYNHYPKPFKEFQAKYAI